MNVFLSDTSRPPRIRTWLLERNVCPRPLQLDRQTEKLKEEQGERVVVIVVVISEHFPGLLGGVRCTTKQLSRLGPPAATPLCTPAYWLTRYMPDLHVYYLGAAKELKIFTSQSTNSEPKTVHKVAILEIELVTRICCCILAACCFVVILIYVILWR